ncbi:MULTISPECIES: hypothetical protein [Vibrio]|uniref:hypothetical protein n=1 Tax=Vibrio TaxID=662 RepID=UPI0021D02301|nr:hypothetical protein [Vibrio sp. YT-19(2023)]ELB2920785.1 hypothetical protein [Vibrio alginolyticus]MDW1499909.1 hypothetical protein [Vibrio sp. YT-19(2023)]
MSKFLLCSSERSFNNNVENSLENNFSICTKAESTGYFHVSYKKLNNDKKDYFSSELGKVSSVGSFIYRNQTGTDGLKNILIDFLSHKNISKLKSAIIGNYSITIELENEFYCFCDGNDVFDLFYFLGKDNWAISNNLNDVVSAIDGKVEPNKNAILEMVIQNGILDNQTIFRSVFRLKGYEYLYLSREHQAPLVLEHENIYFDIESHEGLDYTDLVTKQCTDMAKIISSSYKNVSVCMTGGLDSRITLSSYLSVGVAPSLFYGVGDSSLTNTKMRDLEIVKLVKDEFDLNLKVMDWSAGIDIDDSWSQLIEKFGLLGSVYSGIPNVHKSLSEFDGDSLVDFGYFGEPLRNVESLSAYKKDIFTLEQFIDDIYLDKNAKASLTQQEFEEFREYLYQKAKGVCVRYNLDTESLSKDDFCKIHNEYRKSADTALVNLMNYYCYSINLLSLPQIETMIKQIPAKEKANSSLMLKIVNHLDPNLLKLPIFSHCRNSIFCSKTYTLKLAKSEAFKEGLKSYIYKVGLYRTLKELYSKVRASKNETPDKNGKIKEKLIDMYNANTYNFCSMGVFKGADVRKVSKYNYLVRMIEKENSKNN